MENKQNILLAMIQQVVTILDDIDKIIDENPNNQQQVDFLISDYLHLIQNKENLSPKKKLEVYDELSKARIDREIYNNVYIIAKTYTENAYKLTQKNNRKNFVSSIENTVKRLNQDYNYRVLDKGKLDYFLTDTNNQEEVKVVKKRKTRGDNVTKEDLLKDIENGLKNIDIAKKYNLTPSYIVGLKKQYGIETRTYKKRG